MHNDVVPLRDDELMFVTQGVGCVADQIEESIATRFDVRAVLDIVRGPILLSGGVVPLVKQCVEGVEYQRLIFLLYCLTHNNFLLLSLTATALCRFARSWELLCYLIDPLGIERDMSLGLRNSRKRILV